jgi:hypothetical protein
MPAKDGFQFTSSDLTLVLHIHELRLATIEQVATLAGRSYKQLADRLAKLETQGYVSAATRRPNKYLYAVGREGMQALIREGYAPHELAAKRLRHTELCRSRRKTGPFWRGKTDQRVGYAPACGRERISGRDGR